MANEKKMTKATAWTIVKGIVEQSDHPQSAELIEKIENELALLAKKNSADKKPTAKQTANASIQDSILDTMSAEPNRLFTITELCKEVPGLPEDMTNQRMSALVRQLIPTQIERVEDKRKAYFRIVQ